MSILVTGGLGLLGRQTLELLASAGRSAISYDRAAPCGDTVAGVEYVTGDLNDYPHLVETLRRHEVEAIVHTAAASGPMVRAEAPFEVCQWNVMGTVAVYEVARLFGLRRVVYCSSNAVYGHTEPGPVSEESPLHPLSVYGATKAAGELLGESYAVQFGLDVVRIHKRLRQRQWARRRRSATLRFHTGAHQAAPSSLPSIAPGPRSIITAKIH